MLSLMVNGIGISRHLERSLSCAIICPLLRSAESSAAVLENSVSDDILCQPETDTREAGLRSQVYTYSRGGA